MAESVEQVADKKEDNMWVDVTKDNLLVINFKESTKYLLLCKKNVKDLINLFLDRYGELK